MASVKDMVVGARPGCIVEMRPKNGVVGARLTFDHRTWPSKLVIEPDVNDFWRMKFLADVFDILIEVDPGANPGRNIPDSRLDAEVFAVLDKNERVTHLKLFDIEVLEPTFNTIDDVLLAVIEKLGTHGNGLRYAIQESRSIWGGEKMVTITSPRDFIFWKDEWKPNPQSQMMDLHIVPGYHPCMEHPGKRTILINGCTSYAIQETGLQHVYPPQGSQSGDNNQLMGSWTHMNNPFNAKGKEFAVTVDSHAVRTDEGADAIYNLLRGALEIDGAWVGVNGGFRAPLPNGHNRLLEVGCASPYPRATPGGNLARGSEEHCVWAYYHLLADDRLKDAHIPEWFIKEGWLQIYDGVNVEHCQH